MIKRKLLAVAVSAAAVAAHAVTTTLEYENRREAATRAAVSNDIAAAIAAIPAGGVSTNDVLAIVGPTIAAAQAQFAATGTVYMARGMVYANGDHGKVQMSFYHYDDSGTPRFVVQDGSYGNYQLAYSEDVAGKLDAETDHYQINMSTNGVFVRVSPYYGENWGYYEFTRPGLENSSTVARLDDIAAAQAQFAATGTVYRAQGLVYDARGETGGMAFGGYFFDDNRPRFIVQDGTVGTYALAYLEDVDFSTNNTALVETIAATAGGGQASGLELTDENGVAWTLGVGTNGCIFTYIKEANQ